MPILFIDSETIYLSRRACWVNLFLCVLFSPFAGYIYTRRWIAMLGYLWIVMVISGLSVLVIEDDEDHLRMIPIVQIMLTAYAIGDNDKAIKKAKKDVSQINEIARKNSNSK